MHGGRRDVAEKECRYVIDRVFGFAGRTVSSRFHLYVRRRRIGITRVFSCGSCVAPFMSHTVQHPDVVTRRALRALFNSPHFAPMAPTLWFKSDSDYIRHNIAPHSARKRLQRVDPQLGPQRLGNVPPSREASSLITLLTPQRAYDAAQCMSGSRIISCARLKSALSFDPSPIYSNASPTLL